MGRGKCGAPAPRKCRRCCFQPHVLHCGVAMGLVPSRSWVLCLAMASPAEQFAMALGSRGFSRIPWLGSIRDKRGTKRDSACPVQHRGCFSLGVELVACPSPCDLPARAVTRGRVLPARLALCSPGSTAVLQHHLVLWDGEAQHPSAPLQSCGCTVGRGRGCPVPVGCAAKANLPGNPTRLLVMGMNRQNSVSAGLSPRCAPALGQGISCEDVRSINVC